MLRPALVIGSLATAILITTAPLTALDGRRAPRDDGVAVTLELIKELRVTEVVEDEDGTPNFFDQPGLELKFAVTPPAGRTIVEFDEPTQVIATDDQGTDLTDVPKNMFGRTSLISATHVWDEPVSGFTMKLALPNRAASSFTVDTSFTALTYETTNVVTLTPTTNWTSVGQPDLGESVEYRIAEQHGSVAIEFRPGTVKERIEKLELVDGKTSRDSQGTMWNEHSVSYMYGGKMKAGLAARMTMRLGVERVPVEVMLGAVELP